MHIFLIQTSNINVPITHFSIPVQTSEGYLQLIITLFSLWITSYLPTSERQCAQTNREDEHWKSTQVDKWSRIIDPQTLFVTHSCLLSWYYSYLCSAWVKISELEEQATKLLLFLEWLHCIVSVKKPPRFDQNFKEIL